MHALNCDVPRRCYLSPARRQQVGGVAHWGLATAIYPAGVQKAQQRCSPNLLVVDSIYRGLVQRPLYCAIRPQTAAYIFNQPRAMPSGSGHRQQSDRIGEACRPRRENKRTQDCASNTWTSVLLINTVNITHPIFSETAVHGIEARRVIHLRDRVKQETLTSIQPACNSTHQGKHVGLVKTYTTAP